MRKMVESIESQFQKFKALAEAAIEQVDEADLSRPVPDGGNSIAVICWHISGNLKARFTDFLTTDGEKPWRRRDEEFQARAVSRGELLAKWAGGWDVLERTLASLTDEHLGHTVVIRGESMEVHEALHRSLAHTTYHVGQIVYLGKIFRGTGWTCLSIPLGDSEAYNARVRSASQARDGAR